MKRKKVSENKNSKKKRRKISNNYVKNESKAKNKTKIKCNSQKTQKNKEQAWKWWTGKKTIGPQKNGIKWRTLSHAGPLFPPPYKPLPKTVHFYYRGKAVRLNSAAEEVAGFYAQLLDNTCVRKPVFKLNFFNDWRQTMSPSQRRTITDLSKCDFKQISVYYKKESEKRKQMSREEKLKIKRQNEKNVKKYGYCVVDGHKHKLGNFKLQPPGLFRGRGEHPKSGKLKRRVVPEDVVINIGRKTAVPCPPSGHKWKEVIHNCTVMWLCSWTENVMNRVQYIMLGQSSTLKSRQDWQKYQKARQLKKCVAKVRLDYKRNFKARDLVFRQLSVAVYLIDKLALRAGNDKEVGETADTVGCCSLRVEHIRLQSQKRGKQYVVDFDFLAKDCIRYKNSVCVEKQVFKCLKQFVENKSKKDLLFDRIHTSDLNWYLDSLMPGLTAKVFRTYKASQTLDLQLKRLTKPGMSLSEKLLAYNRANRAVAVLCNHRRAVPKNYAKQMKNLLIKIKDKKKQLSESMKKYRKAKKEKNCSQNSDKFMGKVNKLKDQLKKLETKKSDKEENKQIALGTSKLNYLDPRITVSWCKKWKVSIDLIYNKTQRDKFRWAIETVGQEFRF